jgi:hypothetical protein
VNLVSGHGCRDIEWLLSGKRSVVPFGPLATKAAQLLLIDCFGAARLVLAAQHGQSAAVPAVDSHKGRFNQPIAKPMQVSSWRLVSGLHLAKGRPLGGNQAMGSKPVEPDRRCLHPVYV